jgi:hypothetical protein
LITIKKRHFLSLPSDTQKFAGRPHSNAHPYTHTQFGAVENGITVTKLMQIFSRQAAMMDALISHFAEQMRRRKDGTDAIENNVADDGESRSLNNSICYNKIIQFSLFSLSLSFTPTQNRILFRIMA